jgi:hypothetical protein
MPTTYIVAPGDEYEPGDVFENVPFPNLRHPFKRYRLSTKPQEKNRPEIFASTEGDDKPGDIIHSTFERKTVMLLSHGCELDKVLKLGANPTRRHWSCAPLEQFRPDAGDERLAARQQRIREGTQWNRLYIPPNEFIGAGELCVDLRRITPLPAQYFLESRRVCSLSEDALFDLYSQMGVNQSGLVIYLQPVPCQKCGEKVDPKQFFVPSNDDAEEDVD